MSDDQKIKQIWEFRRRDDDNDSSSDDSESNSVEETVLQKHKLLSNFGLPGTNDISESPRSQNDYFAPEQKKAKTECNGLGRKKDSVKGKKTKRDSVKEANKKKSKRTTQVTVFDDLRIFTESILEDLRVARENMFAKMREEMEILVTAASASKPKRKKGNREQKTGQRQPKKRANASVKTKKCNKQTDANNLHKVLEKRENNDQAIETVTSDEKGYQVNSSSFMTLPSLLSESQVPGNDSVLNFERRNLVIDHTTGHPNYFSSNPMDEPFRSFSQMGYKTIEPSCTGTGYPIPLYQRLDNTFNIPQSVLDSSSRDSNNTVGLKMNGGAVRFSGANHDFPDQFAPNNFRILYPY